MSKNKIKIEDLNVESKKEEKNNSNEALNSELVNLISPNSMPEEIMNEFAENFYNSQQISK